MKKELEDKLFEKYPLLYKSKDKDMTQTCMCWGICVGDGWFDILDRLSNELEEYNKEILEKTQDESKLFTAEQVKEKFGGLRFYTNLIDDKVEELISKAEEEAWDTCEVCGSKDNVVSTKGWIRRICTSCLEKGETEDNDE